MVARKGCLLVVAIGAVLIGPLPADAGQPADRSGASTAGPVAGRFASGTLVPAVPRRSSSSAPAGSAKASRRVRLHRNTDRISGRARAPTAADRISERARARTAVLAHAARMRSGSAATRRPRTRAATPASAHAASATGERPASRAHSASDPNVTISDYKYTPPTITIHVGDKVTWNNDGPSSHTATANDGSFNTGVLSKGASASHTFTQTGTFGYYCQIHPFMHGTIVVLAAAASTATSHSSTSAASTPKTSSTSSTSTTSSQPSASAQSSSQLPFTGLDLTAALLSGILLIGLGVAIRRASRAR